MVQSLLRKVSYFMYLVRSEGPRFAFRYALDRYSPRVRRRYTQQFKEIEDSYPLVDFVSEPPKISVVIPVYRPKLEHLAVCLQSVINQTYPNIEVCICDDGSGNDVRTYLNSLSDSRIKLHFNDMNQGISAATNVAIGMATGHYIAFMDNDDVLPKYALQEVARRLAENSPDFLYTDEDKLFPDGTLGQRFSKPGPSPELLLSCNYVGHLSVVRRSFGDDIGWLRSEYDGSQDYDFVLRVFERTQRIVHIPLVCYHWRISETSVASGQGAKPYAYERAVAAINDALRRRGVLNTVEQIGSMTGHYRLAPSTQGRPIVAVLDARDNRFSSGTLSWIRQLMANGILSKTYELGVTEKCFLENGIQSVSSLGELSLSNSDAVLYIGRDGRFIEDPGDAVLELSMILHLSDDIGIVAPTFVRSKHGRILSAGYDISTAGALIEHRDYSALKVVMKDYRNHAGCRTWAMMTKANYVTRMFGHGRPDYISSIAIGSDARIVINGHVRYHVDP